jgi:hypothetical protein
VTVEFFGFGGPAVAAKVEGAAGAVREPAELALQGGAGLAREAGEVGFVAAPERCVAAGVALPDEGAEARLASKQGRKRLGGERANEVAVGASLQRRERGRFAAQHRA